MRTIITGGTGLIGRALAADLATDGHRVVLLSRTPERATGLPPGVRAERWDAHSAEGWGHLADGAEAVVNLAGESIAVGRCTARRKCRIWESRLNAGRAVVQAVELTSDDPGVVIQASGIGYYTLRGDERIAEGTSAGSDFGSSCSRVGSFDRARRGPGGVAGCHPHQRGAQCARLKASN